MAEQVKPASEPGGAARAARSGPRGLRRAPVQARSRETVEHILDAAEALIDESGLAAATTRAVAERAGVAAPSLYRFFTNRDQILERLLQRHLVMLDAHIATSEEGWQTESIQEFVDFQLGLYVNYFEMRPSVASLWFQGRLASTVVAEVRQRNVITSKHLYDVCVEVGLAAAGDLLPFIVLVELGDRLLELAFREGPLADRAVVAEGSVALAAYLERTLATDRVTGSEH